MKKYSYYLLSQLYWTLENKDKNSMMPVNNLHKDSKSSDALVRANAIKLLTDMCSNLNDIFPFIYEIVKGGIHDTNPLVKQTALISLIKLFENTEIEFSDYQEDL
jgi:vesicle coat complex subunit